MSRMSTSDDIKQRKDKIIDIVQQRRVVLRSEVEASLYIKKEHEMVRD